MTKTNAMRLLEEAKIPFTAETYPVDEDDLSGVHTAEILGIEDPGCMFKTLVTKGSRGGYFVFCIPVAEELDLKKCAAVSGNKRVELVHVKDLLALTGYIRGGCSPIGMKKKFPTYFDESACLYDEITVSAGVRGCQLLLSAEDVISFTDAKLADLTAL